LRGVTFRLANHIAIGSTQSSDRSLLVERRFCYLEKVMKIVVIGGTGRIGSKVVAILRQRGHEVVAAAPNTGVNTITGEGLKEALSAASIVTDVANSPSFEDKAALEFFETSGRHLLAAESAAGVRHHVALSIVGDDRNPDIGYSRPPAFRTPSFARRSSSSFSLALRSRARRETPSECRPRSSSRLHRTT
jgi:NADPH:quinone reductase-like Zn-dependent oxidoreductase